MADWTSRTIVAEESDADYQNMCIDGVEMPNGDIYAAFQYYIPASVNDSFIKYVRSTDGGQTWSSPATLQNTEDWLDLEPQFYRSGNTVYFIYTIQDRSGATENSPSKVYYRTSIDNGYTWSAASLIVEISPMLRAGGTPVRLDSGRVIIPCDYWNGSVYAATCYYSDDNCATWNRGGNATIAGERLNENSMVQLDNGDLLLIARRNIQGLWQARSISEDEGESWSTPENSSIPSPCSMAKVIRMSNGRILIVWNNVSSSETTPRNPLTLGVIDGDGGGHRVIGDIGDSADSRYSNHGVFEKSNGDLIVLYTWLKLSDTTHTALYSCVIPAGDLISPTIYSSKDGRIVQHVPDTNYGGVVHFAVNDEVGKSNRTLLEFQLIDIPAGSTVTSAVLKLKYYLYIGVDPTGKMVKAYKLSRLTWVELEDTWNIYKTGSNWTSPGGDYVTSNPDGGSVNVPESYGWMEIDILAITQEANVAGSPAEILLKFNTEGLGSEASSLIYFRSSEYEVEADRPYLLVGYTLPPSVGGQGGDVKTLIAEGYI